MPVGGVVITGNFSVLPAGPGSYNPDAAGWHVTARYENESQAQTFRAGSTGRAAFTLRSDGSGELEISDFGNPNGGELSLTVIWECHDLALPGSSR